jgi:hypothetical protein
LLEEPGATAESGGAIAMGPAAAAPGIQISNTQFTSNFGDGPAQGVGGAIWAAAGCLVLVDSAFTSNRAIQGGAIFRSPGVVLTIIGSPTTGPTPTAMQFNSNSAVSDAGAIFAFQSNASITNAAFSQNQTPPDQLLAGFGGAIVNLGGSMNISKGFFFKSERPHLVPEGRLAQPAARPGPLVPDAGSDRRGPHRRLRHRRGRVRVDSLRWRWHRGVEPVGDARSE